MNVDDEDGLSDNEYVDTDPGDDVEMGSNVVTHYIDEEGWFMTVSLQKKKKSQI